MRIQYRQYASHYQEDFPLIRAGVDLLGQADLSDQDAECLSSFNGVIDWKMVSSEAGLQGSEIVFGMDSGEIFIALCETDEQGRPACHQLEVEAVVPEGFSTLSCLIHTIMSPSFTPEYIGIDWRDVKAILRSGRKASLVLAKGGEDSVLMEMIRLIRANQGGRIQGSILVFFRESLSLSSFKQANRLLNTEFDCKGLTRLVVPEITDQPEPMLALVVIHA